MHDISKSGLNGIEKAGRGKEDVKGERKERKTKIDGRPPQ